MSDACQKHFSSSFSTCWSAALTSVLPMAPDFISAWGGIHTPDQSLGIKPRWHIKGTVETRLLFFWLASLAGLKQKYTHLNERCSERESYWSVGHTVRCHQTKLLYKGQILNNIMAKMYWPQLPQAMGMLERLKIWRNNWTVLEYSTHFHYQTHIYVLHLCALHPVVLLLFHISMVWLLH